MPPSSKSSKVYAVAVGRTTGIFSSWAECQSQVHGFARAQFQSFRTRDQAETYLRQHNGGGDSAVTTGSTTPITTAFLGTKRQVKRRTSEEERAPFPSVSSAAAVHPKKRPRRQSHHNDSRMDQNNNNSNDQNTVSGGDWHMAITFDGGSRGNPGLAGAGATVTMRSTNSKQATTTIVLHIRDFVGTAATNNEAEYQGLVMALRVAQHEWERLQRRQGKPLSQSQWRLTGITVQGDSQLIIQQLKGTYQCRSEKLKSRYRQAKTLLEQLVVQAPPPHNHKVPLSLEHVYRSDNQVADALANEAMDARRSWITTSADHHETQYSLDDYLNNNTHHYDEDNGDNDEPHVVHV